MNESGKYMEVQANTFDIGGDLKYNNMIVYDSTVHYEMRKKEEINGKFKF